MTVKLWRQMKAPDGRAERGEVDRAAYISNLQEALPAQLIVFEGGGTLSSPLVPNPSHQSLSVCASAEAETP